jgi:hypothetical protein
MDQHARFRSRGVRTIGRLATPVADDVLLAQWPQSASAAHQQQDVAVASEWGARRTNIATRSHQDHADPVLLFESYHQHQRGAALRLLDAIDAELSGNGDAPLVFEPPTTMQNELLALIRSSAQLGRLPETTAQSLEIQTIAAGEWVARCWALIELYRAGLLAEKEVLQKRAQLEQDIAGTAI